jgi:hypothetical protein
MDDANVSGTTITDTIGGINGTAGTGISSAVGPGGAGYATARQFNGNTAQGYITLGSSPFNWLSGGSFSFAAWLLCADITQTDVEGTGNQTYFYDDRTADNTNMIFVWNRQAAPAGHVAFNVCGERVRPTEAVAMTSNVWRHVVYTNEGGGGTGVKAMYYDGVPVGPLTLTSADTGYLQLNHFFGAGNPTVNGTIQNGCRMSSVRLYRRALSALDVAALYAAGG